MEEIHVTHDEQIVEEMAMAAEAMSDEAWDDVHGERPISWYEAQRRFARALANYKEMRGWRPGVSAN